MRQTAFFFSIALFSCLQFLEAQPYVGIGYWQSFLPYNNAHAIAESDEHIFAATELSVFSLHKEDESASYFNKINGLSDMGISTIAFNRPYKTLIIAYSNGNIDFVKPGGKVLNRPAIAQNEMISGSKAVRHIFCDSNEVYLSTDFGLVFYDMDIEEFSKTTFTPSISVRSSARLGNYIYMGTNVGIYRIPNSGTNLLDFGNWQKMGASYGLPTNNFNCDAMAPLQNQLYADVNDTIMRFDGTAWQHIRGIITNSQDTLPYFQNNLPYIKMKATIDGNRLFLATGYNFAEEFNPIQNSLVQHYYDPSTHGNVRDAMADSRSVIWTAHNLGLHKIDYTGIVKPIVLVGPYNKRITDMAVSTGGKLWCAGGPIDYIAAFFDQTGFYAYSNRDWKNYHEGPTPEMTNIWDISNVTVHPKTQTAYFGSFLSGIVSVDKDGLFNYYTKDTPGCSLQGSIGDEQRTRVTGMAFDKDENLWVSNFTAQFPISVMKKDGSWKSFSVPFSNKLSQIAIDRNGYKWILQTSGNLLVFDSGLIDDDTDNRYWQITTGNSQLASTKVNCVVADREGSIWVGTNDGITIFNCGSTIFTQGCNGSRPVVNPDNFNGHLLEAENVRCIAIDGANRKWVGTDNGVFVLSDDGYEQIHYFNKNNSPLFSNNVGRIAIDGTSGMVYMATEKGLIGYRGEATTGKRFVNKDDIYVYPNPVRPEYDGPIAITNLVEDSNVKITDISGNLVYESTALGGQAVWDGYDYTGRRSAAGVYLVFVVNKDATQKLVTKFVIVR